ncbi:MOSC domain-containing protein [Marinomonas sp. BSi20584]|uniref:MOSC domain-containing protein n=1 Tax=Marinomonas sp. BSi20584 TaxID=1594462 RepID=UPI000C1F61E8|nr:MOSC domain-containing protein [Marinomonas sp. BSi20584]PJE56950.1 sulfurase [Marinomonas sp. BSi20584]
MPYTLSELAIYPIKSIQGISLSSSQVESAGLYGDRRYMLVKPDGEFITGRKHPNLTLVTAKPSKNGAWQLSHPELIHGLSLDLSAFSSDYAEVTVWDNSVNAQLAQENANAWFSEIAGETVKLVYFGKKSERFTKRRPEVPVGFADGYPFLLTTEASLAELNRTCPEDIQMAQFRPNLVIKGNKPFEEDSWKRIRIGEVEFENVKPCDRCIFTTLNPITAQRSKKGEPLKTLAKFRLLDKESITFGMNMIALNTGTVYVGDEVEVLEYKEPEVYIDRRKA